jgi:hypothetical protein
MQTQHLGCYIKRGEDEPGDGDADEPVGGGMEDEHEESRPPAMRKVNTRRRTLAMEKMSAVRRKRREAWGLGWGIYEILLNAVSLPILISGFWDWVKAGKGSTAYCTTELSMEKSWRR